tara:strand:- start:4502 stop:4738 length:237 start_codon:yes stop_codon:yes gene_type:complete
MIRYITSYFYEYEFNTLTPNSMYKLNKNKFVNFARELVPNEDDHEPHKNIYEFKQWERKNKAILQIQELEKIVDQLNH